MKIIMPIFSFFSFLCSSNVLPRWSVGTSGTSIHLLLFLSMSLFLLSSMTTVHAETDKAKKTTTTEKKQSTDKKKDEKNDDKEAQEQQENTDTTIQNSMDNLAFIQQTLESLRKGLENSKESTNLNRNNLQAIKDGLKLIDEKLKEAYTGLNESRSSISANVGKLKQLKADLNAILRDSRANAADLSSQKSLIEDNSIRLYELLLQINQAEEKITEFSEELSTVKHTDQTKEIRLEFNDYFDRMWRLVSTIMILFIPLAFVLASDRVQYKRLPDGTEQQHGVLLVSLSAFLAYFLLGFGLSYGVTTSGWVGTTSYLLPVEDDKITPLFPFAEFLFYKSGGILLAALVIYLAVGRQLASFGHMLLAFFVGGILMPVFNHWIEAGQFIKDNKGWLEESGFMDYASITTMSLVAAIFAFIIVWRLGRFSPLPDNETEHAFEYPIYSASAALLLWLGWLSFTTGMLPFTDNTIAHVILNVSLAAMMGGLMAFLHDVFFHANKNSMARMLAGFITGLVAIAASASSVTFVEAMAVGAGAGLLQNIAYGLLRRSLLKQAWQARAAYLIAIHGIGGIWGLLCVALLGTKGMFASPNMVQLTMQFQVIAIAILYSAILANVAFMAMRWRKKPVAST